MARPFRLHPPSLPSSTVARPRLLAVLARRWERRLVTLVAGPGFGKSLLLASALEEPTHRGATDVWVGCEPGDASGDHLVAGLVEALGLASTAGMDAALDAVWARAPAPVCIVLDDVHEIPAGSSGADVVIRLLTDLSENGHLVLASRAAVPVPTARLAASGQLLRIDEGDLRFQDEELAALAAAHDVHPSLLASTGGWPALAALTASAGADLVLDYLWEEVLARLGPQRSSVLARFAVAGGGDDEVATAVAGRPLLVDELVAGVPLIERTATGGAVPHALWGPALRRLLSDAAVAEAQARAAEVHRRRGRLTTAVDLLVEAEAWDGVLAVLRSAAVDMAPVVPREQARWVRALPTSRRTEPEAVLTTALELRSRTPVDALPAFERAATGFRGRGDLDGELAALAGGGLVCWWANDLEGLLLRYGRLEDLARGGAPRAVAMQAVGLAAMAHLGGDSDGVLSALADLDHLDPGWLPTVHWLRSVAHRRSGDVDRARDELAAALHLPYGGLNGQVEVAELRIDWLVGRVDHVVERMPAIVHAYAEVGDHFLTKESGLELACRAAWLGHLDTARAALAAARSIVAGEPGPLAEFLELVATAAIAVGAGDEAGAADLVRDDVVAMLGQPGRSWYWRDRAALSLAHVLVPEARDGIALEPLGPTHLPGLRLAEAVEAARSGDLGVVRTMAWPDAGVARAHLPARWLVELAAAGAAARNPPPPGLLDAVGPPTAAVLRAVAVAGRPRVVALAAKDLLASLPATPAHDLHIDVVGPLDVRCDDTPVRHPHLNRRRVRELLCYLVAHRRVRREVVAEALWPEHADPGHNVRVTLSYLQRVLEPDRRDGEAPYFVRTAGPWLELTGGESLHVDAWVLDARLDEGAAADRTGAPARAVEAYLAALPLWRGEPYADVVDASWAHAERQRLRDRYTAAAWRAGELVLATGDHDVATAAARSAIVADPCDEPAYRLLARARLACDDRLGAQRALADCRHALADLGIRPDADTLALLDLVTR